MCACVLRHASLPPTTTMLRTPRRLFSLAQRCNAAPDTSSPGASSAVKCLHSCSQTKLSRSRCTSLGLGQANYGSAAALAYSGSSSSQEASTSYSQQRAAYGGERTPGNDPNRPEDGDRESVSDREWELRTGEVSSVAALHFDHSRHSSCISQTIVDTSISI